MLRDPEQVALELKLLREKYQGVYLSILDDTPMLNRDWFEKLLRAIRRLAPGVDWGCWARINLMDEALVEEMAHSGCVFVSYGMESGSDNILARMKKNFTVDTAIEVIRYSVKRMQVVVNLIWGFPSETWEDFSQTCMAAGIIRKLKAMCGGFLLAPLPQSTLYSEYGSEIFLHKHIAPGFACTPLKSFMTLEDDPSGPMALILRYPNIFPVFYCYPTERLEEKAQTATKLFG